MTNALNKMFNFLSDVSANDVEGVFAAKIKKTILSGKKKECICYYCWLQSRAGGCLEVGVDDKQQQSNRYKREQRTTSILKVIVLMRRGWLRSFLMMGHHRWDFLCFSRTKTTIHCSIGWLLIGCLFLGRDRVAHVPPCSDVSHEGMCWTPNSLSVSTSPRNKHEASLLFRERSLPRNCLFSMLLIQHGGVSICGGYQFRG